MRKLYTLLLCLLFTFFGSVSVYAADITINTKTFPNFYFREYIKMIYDENEDGKLSDSERNAITEIDIGSSSEYRYGYDFYETDSLKGIEYFPNLEYLDCSGNLLTEIDLSKNKKLKELNCSFNSLQTLDLKAQKDLKVVNGEYN